MQFRDLKKAPKENENSDPAEANAGKDDDWVSIAVEPVLVRCIGSALCCHNVFILQKADEDQCEEEEEDEEADVDEEEADACEDEVGSEEDPEDEGGDDPPKSKAKKAKPDSKKSINKVLGKQPKSEKGKVDGVGAGAVAAAALHTDFDVDTLIKDSKWKEGEPVPYAFLVAAFNEIAPQSKRLAIIATLTNTFRCAIRLTPEDLLPMVYLCTNRVRYSSLLVLYIAALSSVPLQTLYRYLGT